ncbi:uncharacterized protein LOC129610673 [Condylostylus longicornis]|uniref:uncharacterized protein LOC129610673 n=1 Tax=Condylostylus longicornis TaxID=2530218 RepID=UPI00244DAE31|nr:uncharacterized protein LOC129610673 [Condylostylus longicornis]
MVSTVFKLLELLAFAFYGQKLVPEIVRTIEKDPELNNNLFLKSFANFMKQNSDVFIIHMIIDSTIHIIACLLCIYGTYKLKKWFLIPYIITQCFFTIRALFIHITAMLIIKKSVNLGILIGLTIIGGFTVLLLGYQWSGAVGMYQIINLVKSSKYKAFYGNNPFHPIDLLISSSDKDLNKKFLMKI